MLLLRPPQMTVAKMLVGALDICAMPLLQGETPEELMDTAQFYGFSSYGGGDAHYFEYSAKYHQLPSPEDKLVIFMPKDGACRIALHHDVKETRNIPRSADAWRRMVARSPDKVWTLEIGETKREGRRAVTVATVRRV